MNIYKKVLKRTAASLIAVFLCLNKTNAATFLIEDFSTGYIDGNLVGQNGWLQTGTATTNPIQISSGKAVIGTTGQDIYKALTTQIVKANVTSLYTRIDLSVNSAFTGGDYFFNLSDPVGTASNFYQRLFIRSSGSGFVLGVQSTSGTGSLVTYGTTVYNFNETKTIILAWDMVAGGLNDTFSVYVDPIFSDRSLLTAEINANWLSTTGSEPALNISAVNFRQGSATAAPLVNVQGVTITDTFEELGIATIPEPSSSSLLLFGMIGLYGFRRLFRNG